MKPQHIFEAIEILAPGAQVTFTETDLETLTWYSQNIEQPSNSAILVKVEEIIANEPLKAKANAEAKTALFERLGITADEARLLLS